MIGNIFGQKTTLHNIQGRSVVFLTSDVNSAAKGSPYVDEQYKSIKIDGIIPILKARFNGYNGEMEVITDDPENPIALDANRGYVVRFLDSKKSYRNYKFPNEDGDMISSFLVEAHSIDDMSLLFRELIVFNEAKPSKTGYDKPKPAEFERQKDVYYLKLFDDKILPIPRKNKDLSEIFPEFADEIKVFVKKEKIKTNNESDLIKFLNFVSRLK